MFDVFRRHHDTLRDRDAMMRFIENWLDTVGSRVTGALLATAWAIPSEGDASFVVGQLQLMESHEPPRPQHLYSSVRLDDAWIARDEIAPFIEALLSDSKSSLLPELFHLSGPTAEHIYSLHSPDARSGWAEIQIKLTCRANRMFPEWLPAVATALPPFQTWAQAAASWVLGQVITYGADIPYLGQVVVVLPDTRARVTSLSKTASGMSVRLDAYESSDMLELQYLFSRSGNRLTQNVIKKIEPGEIELPHCPDATQLDVFCVHKTLGFLSHSVFSWYELSEAGNISPSDDQAFLAEIATGERETVEFKPFMSIDSDKTRELLRTVVAFANTVGGRVYVGVDNHGSLEGRSGLKRYRSTTDTDGLPTVVASVRTIIHDKIKPVPNVAVYGRELAGEPVCIVDVPSGQYVYSTDDNEILIRKGSTNRRPDPASELAPLLASRS